MGIFKAFQNFGSGFVKGVGQELPGVIEGRRQSAMQQQKIDAERKLLGERLDFTQERDQWDRIANIATISGAETLLNSPIYSANPEMKNAIYARVGAINETRQQKEEELEAADQLALNRLKVAEEERRESERLRRKNEIEATLLTSTLHDRSKSLTDRYLAASAMAPEYADTFRLMSDARIEPVRYTPDQMLSAAKARDEVRKMYDGQKGKDDGDFDLLPLEDQFQLMNEYRAIDMGYSVNDGQAAAMAAIDEIVTNLMKLPADDGVIDRNQFESALSQQLSSSALSNTSITREGVLRALEAKGLSVEDTTLTQQQQQPVTAARESGRWVGDAMRGGVARLQSGARNRRFFAGPTPERPGIEKLGEIGRDIKEFGSGVLGGIFGEDGNQQGNQQQGVQNR